jgi:hypothetical protein
MRSWKYSLLFVMLVALATGAGCNYGLPRIQNWRPLSVQRRQIQRFDPYPDNDIAPVMEGVRPPDFQQQVMEPVRSRWYQTPAVGGYVP